MKKTIGILIVGLFLFGACTTEESESTTTTTSTMKDYIDDGGLLGVTTTTVNTQSYICQDGTFSTAKTPQGACSHHGGVKGNSI